MSSVTETKGKRKASAAFTRPVQPDDKLAQVIGSEAVPRTEVIRKLWDYIRGHNLQDPANKTFIKADANLRDLFEGKERVSMFEMTKLVFSHVT